MSATSYQHNFFAAAGTTVGTLFYKTAQPTLPVPTISGNVVSTVSISKSVSPSQNFREASTEEAMAMFYKLEPRYAELYRELAND